MTGENVDTSMILPVLKKIPLFQNLDENIHNKIIQQIVLMYYPSNYVLFKEGDEGDAMYILKTGQIVIFHEPKEEGDFPQKIADIGASGFFGEMALISDAPRNASAKAKTDCEVFILSKDNFKKLLASNPGMAEQISATVIARMKENDQN